MNDYREVGDLSVQVMLVPEGKREPYPRHYSGTFAFSRFLYPLAHGLPLRVAFPDSDAAPSEGRDGVYQVASQKHEWVRTCL